jgi:uncharacterized protein
MKKLTKSKSNLETDSRSDIEYIICVIDLINNPAVRSMEKFIQHSDLSCFEHSINVSYNSYLICRRLGLDYEAAARGSLLHDFFLYDWHIKRTQKGLHGFTHPYAALENANKYFSLNDVEKDIIVKHMWPLTLKLPKYKEALIVCFVDKYCAFMEVIWHNNRENIYRIKEYASQLDSV